MAGRQHQDARVAALNQQRQDGQRTDAAQVEVQHDDVRRECCRQCQRLGAVRGHGNDPHAGLFTADQPFQAPQHGLVVVHQHHADGWAGGSHGMRWIHIGISICTEVWPRVLWVTRAPPPSAAARSASESGRKSGTWVAAHSLSMLICKAPWMQASVMMPWRALVCLRILLMPSLTI